MQLQEDIENRTIALSVKASKLTAQVLAKALAAAVHKIQQAQREGQTPHGRQSVKKLMNHGAATNSLPLDGDTKPFDRIARKYNIDYAFHKTEPEKHLLFFKAGQADAITAAFSEYSKLVMARGKSKRPPILEQLKKLGERERARPQEREHTREAARDER